MQLGPVGISSYRGYGAPACDFSAAEAGSSRNRFFAMCLGILDGDKSGLIQFSTQDFAADVIEAGKILLQSLEFTVDTAYVPMRHRANPRFDQCIRLKKKERKE